MQSQLIEATWDSKNNDFIELLIYNKDEGVLMTGKMTDGDEDFVTLNLLLKHIYGYL